MTLNTRDESRVKGGPQILEIRAYGGPHILEKGHVEVHTIWSKGI